MDIETLRKAVADGVAIALDGQVVRLLLPQRYPIMMVDRVVAYFPGEKRMIGLKNLSRNEPFLQGHFPEYPIFPGVLITESVVQTSGCLMNCDYVLEQGTPPERLEEALRTYASPKMFLAESKIKHIKPIFPGEQILLESQITLRRANMCTFRVCAWIQGEEATKGQVTMALPSSAGSLRLG
jgi:3-hydroxyacyl-[acyl-carrier-protein] dehydratase